MAIALIGWELLGTMNVHKGSEVTEYDANRCFVIVFVLPLWCSLGQCVHVIERQGECKYLPLRPRLGLRLMIVLYTLVWLFGCLSLPGLMAFFDIRKPHVPPMDVSAPTFALTCKLATLAFIPAWFLYLWLRTPSPRQQTIRGTVLQTMGVHSDPAEWLAETARPFLFRFGMPEATTTSFIQLAEHYLHKGEYESALLAARFAIAFAESDAHDDRRSAETVTDQAIELVRSRTDKTA